MVIQVSHEMRLDLIFSALAHPTRREMIQRLRDRAASVSDFLEVFKLSGPAISKHLKVLEDAGLVRVEQDKQTRYRVLNAEALGRATEWLDDYRIFWEGSFDRLENLAREMEKEK